MISPPKEISTKPGVYIFRAGSGAPLYIGKAANLKKRLVSYWQKDVSDKIRLMVKEATKLEWIEAESEIDALIKESELIKKHIPKYNILMRDDKNYFYVGLTKEVYPRIFFTHQPRALFKKKKIAEYIGPFTSGTALKSVLRLLRSIFPYCTCTEIHKRPCLSAQIRRCPGYCCLKSEKLKAQSEKQIEYRKNIGSVAAVLKGRRRKIIQELKREMREAAKNQEFEKAGKTRDQIFGLENIAGHPILPNGELIRRPYDWDKIQKNLKSILGITIQRAEGYDISNISGEEATGSMVVFTQGRPDKNQYRKFKIKTVRGANDIAMHQEVIRRRLEHPEWKMPDLMLIDGGKAQLNAAIAALRNYQLLVTSYKPKVAALAKREEELYIEGRALPLKLAFLPPETAFFFQRIRDESHRFAKKYHHKRREILYRG